MPYFRHQQTVHDVRALGQDHFEVDGQPLDLTVTALDSHHYLLRQGRQQQALYAQQSGDTWQVWYEGEYYELQRQARATAPEESGHSGRIAAPLTGKVIVVSATAGSQVAKGASLVILESMKMETALSAPFDARVIAVHCQPGEQIANGQLLVELEALSEPAQP